jgi:hypothetical protein
LSAKCVFYDFTFYASHFIAEMGNIISIILDPLINLVNVLGRMLWKFSKELLDAAVRVFELVKKIFSNQAPRPRPISDAITEFEENAGKKYSSLYLTYFHG